MTRFAVGDIIVSASSDSYLGEIVYISKEEDTVRHRCRKTGKEYEKSYFGFQCRYMTVGERLSKDAEFCRENIKLHQDVIALTKRAETAEANFNRVREELRQALDGREREYQRAEEALEKLALLSEKGPGAA